MNEIAIMQPYVFPYIGYFQLLNVSQRFILLDDVNFIMRGWINRNQILLQKKAHMFTVPLVGAGRDRIISDIEICNDTSWQAKLDKTLVQAYSKAPHFAEVMNLVREVINSNEVKISALALRSIKMVAEYLSIDTDIVASSSQYSNSDLKGAKRIITIVYRR